MSQQLKKQSRVMRISAQNYNRFTKAKERFARRQAMKRCTYDQFFEQLMQVAEALMAGQETYMAHGKVYEDLADARGECIRVAVKLKQAPIWPDVCVRLGQDPGPQKGN
jgi:hypothetical protein